MSKNDPEIPRISGSNEASVLGKDDFFNILATSGLGELTAGAFTTIHLDSTPREKDEIYLSPDGRLIYGFMTKFDKGFTGWKKNDLVRARFIVKSREDKVSLLVADSYIGDIRHADEFVLEGDEEELAKLKSVGLAELDLNVELTSDQREYLASNMFLYRARIDSVNAVTEVWDGQSELEAGPVLLQGRVVDYVETDIDDNTNKKPTFITISVNGRPVTVNLNGGYLTYEGSRQYENLLNEQPEIGDLVQILASYDPDYASKQKSYERPRVSSLDASWCRSAYCLEANPDRSERQANFNDALETAISELGEATEPTIFKQKYGQIINMAYQKTDRNSINNCLTAHQRRQMSELVKKVFASNDTEKPLLAVKEDFPSVFSTVVEEFGIDIYSMSVDEVYKAMMEIASDPEKLHPKSLHTDYIFRILEGAATPQQMSALAIKAIESYYPITVRKGLLFDADDPSLELLKVHYNQHSLVERAISVLGATGLPKDIEFLAGLFKSSVKNDQFSHQRGEDDYLQGIVASLNHSLSKNAKWSLDQDWYEITNHDGLKYFREDIIPTILKSVAEYTKKVESIGEINGERHAEIVHAFVMNKVENLVKLSDKLNTLA